MRQHFITLNNNRIQNKKAVAEYWSKEQPMQDRPNILEKSKKIVGERDSDIVEVLYKADKKRQGKVQNLKRELQAKE